MACYQHMQNEHSNVCKQTSISYSNRNVSMVRVLLRSIAQEISPKALTAADNYCHSSPMATDQSQGLDLGPSIRVRLWTQASTAVSVRHVV